jgi:solute carrier family 25 citrate transporter 1
MSEEKAKGGHSHVSPLIKGFAGSIGGVAEACVLQPMDVIKTRLQLDKAHKYKGIINCGTIIAKEEGVAALWKGLTPFATHLTLKYALRMGSNSVYQSMLRGPDGKLSDGGRMAAGFMAGITEALVIVTPFEVVKIRLQQQKGLAKGSFKYKGPVHCAATILREEGLRGLWSGATPTVLRNGTNQMCLFWAKNNMDKVRGGPLRTQSAVQQCLNCPGHALQDSQRAS